MEALSKRASDKEFELSKAVVDKNDFKSVKLVKGNNITDNSFDRILMGMPGVLPGFNVEKPRVEVGFELKKENGKLRAEMLGPLISVEGYYEGKNPSLHIPANDPNARKLIVHFGVVPERIKLEIEDFVSEDIKKWVERERAKRFNEK